MKYLAFIVVFSALSFAGVAKFSAKHVVKPAAKVSAKAAKKSAQGAVKAVKAGKKVLY